MKQIQVKAEAIRKERLSQKSVKEDLSVAPLDDDDRSKFSFGSGYHEFRTNLRSKAAKMKHYAGSVPKPKPKGTPVQDVTKIQKLPGTHILPPI